MKPFLMQFDTRYWYRPHLTLLTGALLPFSWLFGAVAAARRLSYRKKIFTSHHFNVPIIVVGNITVGGTGKTPCVIALAQYFAGSGFRPGIVSRGVGGARHKKPKIVSLNAYASDVGDEALLLAHNSQCPVVVGIDRVAALSALFQTPP